MLSYAITCITAAKILPECPLNSVTKYIYIPLSYTLFTLYALQLKLKSSHTLLLYLQGLTKNINTDG